VFDFPSNPSAGQTVTNGAITYTWDGQKWVVGGSLTTYAIAEGLTGAGTNQSTALLLNADFNVVTSCPAGAGFKYNASFKQQVVLNNDPSHVASVYPPAGAKINGQAVNAPFVMGMNGARVTFTAGASPGTQIYAG